MSLILEITKTDGSIVTTSLDATVVSVNANPGDQFRVIDANGNPVAGLSAQQVGDSMQIDGLPELTQLEICGFFDKEGDADACVLTLPDGQTIVAGQPAVMMLAANDKAGAATATDASAASAPAAAPASSGATAAAANTGLSTSAIALGTIGLVGAAAAASSSSSDPTAPGMPTNIDVEGDDLIINAAEAADGITVTGNAEAGSTVTVTIGAQSVEATTGSDGTFSATIATVPADGTYAVSVRAQNDVGNSDLATLPGVQIATVPPAAPTGIDVEGDDLVVNATEAADGVTITGNAALSAAGNAVTVTFGTASVTTASAVQPDGSFSVTIPFADLPAQGTYDVVVTVANDAGPSTSTTLANVQLLTNTPAAPTAVTVEGEGDNSLVDATEAADGVAITGTAEAGSTVNLTWGTATGTATAAGDGSFTITIATGDVPANGTYDMLVTATNSAGTGAAATISNVQALTRVPATPTALDVEGDDTTLTTAEAADGIDITGTAEVGSTVVVTWGGFTSAATAVDGTTGAYSITVATGDVPLDGGSQISVIATNAVGNSAAQTLDVTVDRGAGGMGTGATIDGSTIIQVAGDITGTANNDVLVGGAGGEVSNSTFDFWEISSAAGASVLNAQTFGGLQFVTTQGGNGGTNNPDIGWTFNSGRALPTTTATIGAVGNNQYDTNQANIDPGFGEIELVRDPTTGNTVWETVTSTLSGGGGLTQNVVTQTGQNYDLSIDFALPAGQTHQTAGTSFQITWDGSAIAFFDATANGGAGDWIVDGPNGLSAPTATTATSWTFDGLAASGASSQLGINAYENYGGTGAAVTNDGIGLRISNVSLAAQTASGAETISGADGADLIFGQAGDDTLTGGNGADTFVFSMGSDNGANTITDFTVGTDRIMLTSMQDTVLAGSGVIGDGAEAGEADRSYTNLSINDLLGGAGNQAVAVSDSGGNVMLTFTSTANAGIGSVVLTGVSAATYVGADDTASLTNLRNAGILDWTNDGFNTGLI